MAIGIGTSQESKQEAGAYGTQIPRFRVKELNIGDHRQFRIVQGVQRSELIFYPTIVQDRETGRMRPGKKVIIRDPQSCLFDPLVEAERRVYRGLTAAGDAHYKDKTPELAPSKQWSYIALDLKEGDHTNPKLIELIANWSVFQEIVELEEKEHPQKPGFLRNGLNFMYDIDIYVTKDPTNPRFPKKYRADVATEPNPFAGRIPKQHLDMRKFPLDPEIQRQCFTDEEWEAIHDSELDLAKINKPHGNEKIMELLEKFPLYLYGSESFDSDRPGFPEVDAILEVCTSVGIPVLERGVASKYASLPANGSAAAPAEPAEPVVEAAPAEAAPTTEAPEAAEAEDAVYEEVPKDEPATPTKSAGLPDSPPSPPKRRW